MKLSSIAPTVLINFPFNPNFNIEISHVKSVNVSENVQIYTCVYIK